MVINNSTWYFDNNSHFEVNNTVGDLHYIHTPWSELCSNWIIKWTIGTISASLHWKRIFSLIFGWEHYLKDCTMQEPFFNLFLFFFFWERFFPSLKGRNIRKLHCGKIFFKIFFFSSTGWVFTLIFGCIFYLKDITMQEYYSFYLFFYYWERFFSHFWEDIFLQDFNI